MKVTLRASEALTVPPTSTLHFLRSVILAGSQASLSALFVAADATSILMGIGADVDNNETRENRGAIVVIFKYCPRSFIDH